ncbi:hypothetical protein HWV62_23655 [Athelia sp. TMB]|nr:hypothetical protein HWV62_25910 [Athelia sp. TMB]KAF7970560.1 hypothetical protein HWV62_23655 [Athelia sp. TMB]
MSLPNGLSSLDSVLRILESIAASDGARDAFALSGLDATARIGVQIIEASKKSRTHNKRAWMNLAERIAWLLIPVEEALRGHEVYELDPVLKVYLRNLNSDLEKILRIARTQTRHSRFSCMSHMEDEDEDLARCQHLVNRAYRIPAVHYWPPETNFIRPARVI